MMIDKGTTFYRHICLMAICIGSVILAFSCFYGKIFYFNSTESAPVGIYYAVYTDNLQRGDYVIIPFPQYDGAHNMANHLLLKRVAGLPGDEYLDYGRGIIIRDEVYPRPQSGLKTLTKAGKNIVPKGAILLLNKELYSFDSRYFGTVGRKQIVCKAVPMFCLDKQDLQILKFMTEKILN